MLLFNFSTFLIVSVSSESCFGFLDFTRGKYFLCNLPHLFLVQFGQILKSQFSENVCRVWQLLHSRTTKSVPQLKYRCDRIGLNRRIRPAIFLVLFVKSLLIRPIKFCNILSYLYQFVNIFYGYFLVILNWNKVFIVENKGENNSLLSYD